MKRDRQQQEILSEAVRNAFLKLDPRIQWKNPVMFIVFLGAILAALLALRAFLAGNTQEGWFNLHILLPQFSSAFLFHFLNNFIHQNFQILIAERFLNRLESY